MRNTIEVVNQQNQIIKIQSDVINELFILLMQHIEVSEVDRLPVVAKINEAAKIQKEVYI